MFTAYVAYVETLAVCGRQDWSFHYDLAVALRHWDLVALLSRIYR